MPHPPYMEDAAHYAQGLDWHRHLKQLVALAMLANHSERCMFKPDGYVEHSPQVCHLRKSTIGPMPQGNKLFFAADTKISVSLQRCPFRPAHPLSGLRPSIWMMAGLVRLDNLHLESVERFEIVQRNIQEQPVPFTPPLRQSASDIPLRSLRKARCKSCSCFFQL